MVRICAIMAAIVSCTAAQGNVGVFMGSGHTIKLIRSADVQMVSEEVKIVAGRGRFPFDGSLPGMNHVEYDCKFVLKNRSAQTVAIQVGFPLNSQFLNSPVPIKKVDDTDVVLQYKFIARDRDKTYHVRFAPYDQTKRLTSIFLWDMGFRAGETRELRVAYQMPISLSLASAAKDMHHQEYAKRWYDNLERGLIEGFGYVTETGRSWAGSIEKAEIHLELGGFEKYLKERRVVERSVEPEESSDRPEDKDSRHGVLEGNCRDWLMHRRIEPQGWTEKDGKITWQFKGRVPDGPVAVSYLLVGVPQSVEGLHALVQSTLKAKPIASDTKADDPFGDAEELAEQTSPSKLRDNLADLREILLASWGVVPRREPIRAFVANQVWYAPNGDVTEKALTPQQKRVLVEVDRMSTKSDR